MWRRIDRVPSARPTASVRQSGESPRLMMGPGYFEACFSLKVAKSKICTKVTSLAAVKAAGPSTAMIEQQGNRGS